MHTSDNENNDKSPNEEDRHAIDPASEDPITISLPVVAISHPNKRQKHNFSDEFRSFLARKLPRKFVIFEKNETCEWYQNDDQVLQPERQRQLSSCVQMLLEVLSGYNLAVVRQIMNKINIDKM